jgi:hypothetical protein
VEGELDKEGNISDAFVLIGSQFNNVLKKMDSRPRTNVQNISLDINKQMNSQRKTISEENTIQGK